MSNVSEEILIKEVHNGVEQKEESVRNTPARYLIKACVSGLIIILGYLAYFYLATNFSEVNGVDIHHFGKFMASAFFPLCLITIYYTKSELLTSNMMMVSVAKFFKKINWSTLFKILLFCFIGNALGGIIFGLVVAPTSVMDSMYETIATTIEAKENYIANQQYIDCLFRAILCGICINLPMIAIYKNKNMDGITKFLLMFFGVFIFAYLGFEHSVANTVLFEMTWLYELFHHITTPVVDINAIYNVIIVIIGNMIGGAVIAIMYSIVYNKK